MGQLHVGRPACTAADRSADDFEIVGLLREAAVGAEAAITAICEGYRPRLRRLIRSWDGNRISPAEDEEDLAQEVLCLLHRYVLVGKFAQIATGNEFWNMTKQMTHNIVSSRRRHYGCRKRGGHRRVDADFDLESVPAPPPPEVYDEELEAEFYAFLYVEFSCEPLFWLLFQMQELEKPAEEMARVYGISVQTVYFKLRLRERRWQEYRQLSDETKRARRKIEDARRNRITAAAYAERLRELAERGETRPDRSGSLRAAQGIPGPEGF